MNMTSIGMTPVLGVSVSGLKIENKGIALRKIGGKLKFAVGGTETEIGTFSQFVHALISFA